jgi:hypothetical protein
MLEFDYITRDFFENKNGTIGTGSLHSSTIIDGISPCPDLL